MTAKSVPTQPINLFSLFSIGYYIEASILDCYFLDYLQFFGYFISFLFINLQLLFIFLIFILHHDCLFHP